MPYSGITDATVNAKIDRCVQAVVKQGHDKSMAVAICRAAIPGAMTRKAEAAKAHDYQSTQFDMPPHVSERISLFQRIFDPADLAADGLETDSHVTVFYGLTSATSEQLTDIVSKFGPVKLDFGNVSLFENPEFDVVKVEVESGKLRELNARLAELPNENEWRTYDPHLTIAYVKPGRGQKYLINPLQGMSVTVDTLIFSDRDDSKTSIPLARQSDVVSAKAEADAPNYHDAGPANLNICETCRFSRGNRQCTKYDFHYRNGWTCDAWRPNVEATRKRHQELSKMDATKAQTLKREIPNRGDLTGGNFLYPDLRSFPIVKPEDVKAAASAWGRASKVRAAGHTFEDFKKRLTAKAKAKGAAFVAMLPKGWTTSAKEVLSSDGPSFKVYKSRDGQYRWLSISSTAYQDRDGEYVSLKALQADVERADADGDYGPLRFWHQDGWDIGDCTFNMMVGKALIEGGTFRRKEYAEALIKRPPSGVSIGYKHRITEPDPNGVFHSIKRFERSVLPKQARPSNLFTSFISLKEDQMATQKEKLQALFEQFQDAAKNVLTEAAQIDTKAAEQGVSFKEQKDLSKMNADDLLLYALERKEAEAKTEAEADEYDPEPPETEETEEAPLTAKEFKAAMGEFAATFATAIKEALTGQPQTVDRKKEIDAAAGQIEATKKQVTELATQLKAAQAQLAELTGDQPKAIKAGYRASQQAPAIEAEAEAAKAAKEMAAKSDPWGLGHIQQTLGVGWPGANNGQ